MAAITRRQFLQLAGSAAGGALLRRAAGNPRLPQKHAATWRFPLRFPCVFVARAGKG